MNLRSSASTLMLFLLLWASTTTLFAQIPDCNPSIVENIQIKDISCDGESLGSIQVTIDSQQVGNFSIVWPNTNFGNTDFIDGLSAGTYRLELNFGENEDCLVDDNLIVYAPIELNECGDFNGEGGFGIGVSWDGGEPPYMVTYSGPVDTTISNISFNSNSVVGIPPGNYTVTVADANQCTSSCTAGPECNLQVSVKASQDPTCTGDTNGSVELTVNFGTPPLNYQWSTGSTASTLTNVGAGTYSVTVTDNLNCSDILTVTLADPAPIIISSINNNPSCAGNTDGAISLSVTGATTPISYNWSVPGGTSQLTGIGEGPYSVTVTDGSGCVGTYSTALIAPPELSFEPTVNEPNCAETNDGAISIEVGGGTPPYSYSWNTGATTAAINNLEEGSYSVTIEDSRECTGILSITLTAPEALTLSCRERLPVSYQGANDGEALLDFSGGTAPYTLILQGPISDTIISPISLDQFILNNLASGSYTLTLRDTNSCEVVCNFDVAQPLYSCTFITDNDLVGGETYTWLKDSCYILDGLVYLEEGGELNIEAGALVKGLSTPNTDDPTSALIITNGATINALGTAREPIVFTAEQDRGQAFQEISYFRGIWGGLVLLGDARITPSPTSTIFALPSFEETDPRNQFNGDNDADNSGILQYISIRNAGYTNDSFEMSGLTLAGVGTNTNLSFIEVFNSNNDSYRIIGGLANLKNAISAFSAMDDFDWSLGWRGNGQFWFALRDNTNGNSGDHFGTNGSKIFNSNPNIYNASFIGSGSNLGIEDSPAENRALSFQSSSAGTYANSIFTDYKGYALLVEDVPETEESPLVGDSKKQLEDGVLQLKNNIFGSFTQGAELNAGSNGILDVSPNAEDPNALFLIDHLLFNANTLENPDLIGISRSSDGSLDPRPRANSAYNDFADYPDDDFFRRVAYKGAFGCSKKSWASDWTVLDSRGYLTDTFEEAGDFFCMEIPGPDTFIVQFAEDLPPDSIRAVEDKIRFQGGIQLDSCYCRSNTPYIQSWGTQRTIEINSSSQGAMSKTKVDTSGTTLKIQPIVTFENDLIPLVFCIPPPQRSSRAADVRIAIIDSGVNLMTEEDPSGHEDLDNLAWRNGLEILDSIDNDFNCLVDDLEGYDFLRGSSVIRDLDGHGTHLAGIIYDGFPTHVRPQIMNLKVYEQEEGTVFELICALNHALEKNAQVINLSLGYKNPNPSILLYDALKKADSLGTMVIVSAGNDQENLDNSFTNPRFNRWPVRFKEFNDQRFAPLSNLLVVASLDSLNNGIDYSYSNYSGRLVDIATRGQFTSTYLDNGYESLKGTSMSTAYVSKLVAIAKAWGISNQQILDCIYLTSDNASTSRNPIPANQLLSNGRLNFEEALACMLNSTELPPELDGVPADRNTRAFIENKNLQAKDYLEIRIGDGETLYKDITFKVQDQPGGGQLRTIFSFQCAAASKIIWNCVDDTGNMITVGDYFVEITVGTQKLRMNPNKFVKVN